MLFVSVALASTLTVGPSGTYATIGEAEDVAVSGDIIEIEGGTFVETLDPAGRDLTYTSPDNSTISGMDPCLSVYGGEDVLVQGLVFDGCTHAVASANDSHIRVEESYFNNNSCQYGCAFDVSDDTAIEVVDSHFYGNASATYGGSIYADQRASVTIEGSDFSDGSAVGGGHVAFASSGTLTIVDSVFTDGTASSVGGSLYVSGAASVTIEGTTISGGRAYSGGGVYVETSPVRFTDVDFTDNTAAVSGGGAYLLGSHTASFDVIGGTVARNTAGGDGGGWYLNDYEPVQISGTHFTGNSAAGDGGGLFVHGNYGSYGPTEIDGVFFDDNVATGNGGGLWTQTSGDLLLSGSVFRGNSGVNGGGLGTTDTTVSLDGLLFLENDATEGGGAYFAVSTLSVDHATFACNDASTDGGAIWASASSLSLGDSVIGWGSSGTWADTGSFASVVTWENISYAWSGVSDPSGSDGNVDADPGVRAVTCDGVWSDDDLAPAAGSILVDAGSGTDVDGSTADIGGYGGSSGDLDVDEDTWGYWDGDCDESDAGVNPDAAEVWYDGVDQDCSGSSDFDQDLDAWDLADDCDDLDAAVYPGAPEVWYDGTDADCSGTSDFDQDLDGWDLADDCDDLDPAIAPDAAETWYDGVDQDCSASSDYDQDGDGYDLADDCDDEAADVNPAAAEVWYDGTNTDCSGTSDYDQDGDGYDLDEDCDDTAPAVNPGVRETWYDGTDQDCDGNDDDQDGDGAALAEDCDDADPDRGPQAEEIWYDGVDQDCDGNDLDQDGDGYDLADDCDDLDAARFPGATEIWYDGVDTNCDGAADDDQDADGFALAEDCDDVDPLRNPGATEIWYDGIDQDCDANDEDQDGDSFTRVGDCDDLDPAINFGADEIWYDGVDQDCDGLDDDQDGDGRVRADDCDDTDGAVTVCLTRIDGGCNSASGAGAGWMAVVLALLVFLSRPAYALDATGTGRVATDGGLLVPGIDISEGGAVDVALVAGYAGVTAEGVYTDGSEAPLMAGVTSAQIAGAWTLLDGLRATVAVPFAATRLPAGAGLGDVRVAVDWAPIRGAFSLGPSLEVALPTGSADRLSGGGGVGFSALAMATGDSGSFRWTALVGPSFAPGKGFGGVEVDPDAGLRYGAGGRLAVSDTVGIGAEVFGLAALGSANTDVLARSGMEALLTGALTLPLGEARLGAGVGLLDGVGTSNVRVVAGWAARVANPVDRVPDADRDGFGDPTDRCPTDPEDEDGYNDDDGCPDLDDDADDVPDATDTCPRDPEDRDAYQDADGCPEFDNDLDGIPDMNDTCPNQPGNCASRVELSADAIIVNDRIVFRGGTAEIEPGSLPLLLEIAGVLSANPNIRLVEVGAHTDGMGDEAANLRLSTDRAEAVKAVLVESGGVDPSRIQAKGYGETQPLESNATEIGREANRRVEFRVSR